MTGAGTPTPIGVLGGTFDPVHVGHLDAARCARDVFRLERVLLVPALAPPHKTRPDISAPVDRLEMLRLAVAGIPGLDVSTLEIDRGGVSYTIDTLRALRAGPPPAAPLFLIGRDSLFEIHTWREHRAIVDEFDLVVLDRQGVAGNLSPDLASRLVPLACAPGAGAGPGIEPGRGGRIFLVPMPAVPVSSSAVRERAALGLPLAGLVPPGVDRYIQMKRLYQRR